MDVEGPSFSMASTVPSFPQRPPYPQVPHLHGSEMSSAFQSSGSLASLSPPTAAMQSSGPRSQPSWTPSQAPCHGAHADSAPLPSPSFAQGPQTYSMQRHNAAASFGASAQQGPSAMNAAYQQQAEQQMQMAQQQMHQQQQQQACDDQPHQQQQHRHEYQPARDGAGATANQTTALIGELNLVAEAAKRAQVACLMRDMDEMELA